MLFMPFMELASVTDWLSLSSEAKGLPEDEVWLVHQMIGLQVAWALEPSTCTRWLRGLERSYQSYQSYQLIGYSPGEGPFRKAGGGDVLNVGRPLDVNADP